MKQNRETQMKQLLLIKRKEIEKINNKQAKDFIKNHLKDKVTVTSVAYEKYVEEVKMLNAVPFGKHQFFKMIEAEGLIRKKIKVLNKLTIRVFMTANTKITGLSSNANENRIKIISQNLKYMIDDAKSFIKSYKIIDNKIIAHDMYKEYINHIINIKKTDWLGKVAFYKLVKEELPVVHKQARTPLGKVYVFEVKDVK